jgi:DNA-binding GntR family transcriptional regulator
MENTSGLVLFLKKKGGRSLNFEMNPDDFSPQYPVSFVTQITEFLTESIIEGRYESGQRMIENELQKKFGVSRSPIRESFRILEKNGFVVNVPRKGTFVRRMTRKYIEEIFPIRPLLEGLAARLAAKQLTSEETKEMESALSGMAEAGAKNDFKSYLKFHFDYHMVYIEGSRNDSLIGILENLMRHAVWFRLSYLWHQENYEDAICTHREILNLFIRKDTNRVETLVKDHILNNLNRYLQFPGIEK